MWRIMEAGRVYERANFSAPTANNTWNASDAVFATRQLRSLNAFQVSTTEKLFALASCDMYIGVKIGGRVCLSEENNPFAKKKKKKQRAKESAVPMAAAAAAAAVIS
mmetsp:Transcript_36929/g.73684  ORF Transcript_36929/g.73684 Transcript_36929/m.73684 type:complete len:107 (-) Transcript_36929:326-646(-)